jgi:hypothetical protein
MPTNADLCPVFLAPICSLTAQVRDLRMSKRRTLIELSGLVWNVPAGPLADS